LSAKFAAWYAPKLGPVTTISRDPPLSSSTKGTTSSRIQRSYV